MDSTPDLQGQGQPENTARFETATHFCEHNLASGAKQITNT